MIDFNINDYVYVRLTEKGRAILHSQSMSAPAENENGFGKWQLWCLMNTFGPHLCNGAKVPFETTIKITHPTQPPAAMTDQHRATPEQWAETEKWAQEDELDSSCILELRARIEALEAAQLEQAESHRFCVDAIVRRVEALEAAQQDKLDRLIALDRDDPTPDDVIMDEGEQFSAVTARTNGWRPLDIETTYGSEAAADAAQILRAPMVVQGTFEHGGETYRFKAKPEREAPMTELRAASAEAQPGGLVERVEEAIANEDWMNNGLDASVCGDDDPTYRYTSAACNSGHSFQTLQSRAAIREVATWLDRFALHGSGEYAQAAKVLRQEVGQ